MNQNWDEHTTYITDVTQDAHDEIKERLGSEYLTRGTPQQRVDAFIAGARYGAMHAFSHFHENKQDG